jgi:peptide/nickel transport system substrate-binding protein
MRTPESRRHRRLTALTLSALVAGSLVLSGVAAGASTSDAVPGAKHAPVVIGAEEFPPVLNDMTVTGNGEWTAMVAGPALARGYKLLPDFSYEPWIFDKDCTVVSESPFTVDCTLRPEAKWSDGTQITADDFKFTYDTIMNPKNDVVTREGYSKISEFNVVSPTEFQMVFKEVFAPYRELWAGTSTTVLPKHILEGQNFNKVWNNCICDPKTKKPISSGPMMVQSFTPGEKVVLVPNKNYWGKQATVPQVVFVPMRDTNTEINAFRSGEVDMIYPQNQIGLRKKIEAVDGAKYTSSLGPQWEHFDMLTTVKGLDDVAVRQAIATAMPRQQIVQRLVKDANDQAAVLDNVFWMTNQKSYEPGWNIYPADGDIAAANKLLDDAGWAKGSDGVRAKNGVKLAFTIGATSGNQARELAEQIIQQQMKQIGVKFTIKNSPDILDYSLSAYDYQTIIFAWVGSPDPYGGNVTWLSSASPAACTKAEAKKGACDTSGTNYTKVNDPEVDSLLNATDRETDPVKRAALFNQANARLAQADVTSIPLFQKPTQLGYKSSISGVVDNSTQDGFTWNIEDWTYSG